MPRPSPVSVQPGPRVDDSDVSRVDAQRHFSNFLIACLEASQPVGFSQLVKEINDLTGAYGYLMAHKGRVIIGTLAKMVRGPGLLVHEAVVVASALLIVKEGGRSFPLTRALYSAGSTRNVQVVGLF